MAKPWVRGSTTGMKRAADRRPASRTGRERVNVLFVGWEFFDANTSDH